MNTRNCRVTLLGGITALLGLIASSAHASLLPPVMVTNGSQSFYDGNISSTDLINLGSASLGSFVASAPAVFNTEGAHDGNAAITSGLGYWGNPGGPLTLTYTLTGSATGYDINSINTIHGWGDSRERHSAQRYDVEITTVSNPTFTNLTSVVYDPYGSVNSNAGQASTQVTLTDTTGVLASGVTGVRFRVFNDPGGSEVGVIREYDVFGSATPVPEPSTTLLLSGLVSALAFRRRRRAVAARAAE